MSRIHVQLRYPDFTDDDRKRVWRTFVNKLKKERGDTMRLTMDAKDYINGKEMRKLEWNGREIRNGTQASPDGGQKSKIVLTANRRVWVTTRQRSKPPLPWPSSTPRKTRKTGSKSLTTT